MPLNGIDIASHQAGLDLNNIAFDFVIIKATQGIGYVNPYCDHWYQQAKALGKLIGFYHYASGNDAIGEADYFIENTLNYFHEAVPFLDWESDQNGNWGNNDAAWCKAFCDRVYERTGVHPMVYVQASAMSRLEGQIGDCGLWIAQYPNYVPTGYQDEPWNEGAYSCAIRQYSSVGRLDGWGGNLDLDKFYGDATAWMKYANPAGDTPVPTPSPEPVPAPTYDKSVDELAQEVIQGAWGNGDDRRNALTNAGYDYDAVQERVNEILCGEDNQPDIEAMAQAVIRGEYGNGADRRNTLGSYYDEVQARVNEILTGASQPSYETSINVGDRVTPCSDTDYNGTPVTAWQSTYVVSELVGDRAVLINDAGQVWCAMNISNLKRD
jgi:GH25 family lysozyme M1 (1,4-beta-N-acetylmuramidase)